MPSKRRSARRSSPSLLGRIRYRMHGIGRFRILLKDARQRPFPRAFEKETTGANTSAQRDAFQSSTATLHKVRPSEKKETTGASTPAQRDAFRSSTTTLSEFRPSEKRRTSEKGRKKEREKRNKGPLVHYHFHLSRLLSLLVQGFAGE